MWCNRSRRLHPAAVVAPSGRRSVPDTAPLGRVPVNYNHDGCVLVDNLRQRWGHLLVNGPRYAAKERAKVLHPRPRTTWVAPLECELLDRRRMSTVAVARRQVFSFIERSCNTRRFQLRAR